MLATAQVASFNAAGGRCDACAGAGVVTVEMNFPPDEAPCDDSAMGHASTARRCRSPWRDKSIGDVLAMEVDDAVPFLPGCPSDPPPTR